MPIPLSADAPVPSPDSSAWWSGARRRWREKDPELLAVKRSVRAAVVMPLVFGLTHLLFSNPQISLFGAFGSFALLLLVDFQGRPRTRLVSYAGLCVVGAVFIALGTLVSLHEVAAVCVMGAVGFMVLFAGVASPQAATAGTAVLLTFVLPVAVAQPTSAIGPRLLGWVFACVFCVGACMLIWPTPWHDELRRRLSAAVAAVARLASVHAEGGADKDARAAVDAELLQLRRKFAATPYPPTGAAAGAVALAKLVGRIEWVAESTVPLRNGNGSRGLPSAQSVMGAAADVMGRSALLICDGNAHPVDDPVLIRAVQESTQQLDHLITTELDAEVSDLVGNEAGPDGIEAGPDGMVGAEPQAPVSPGEGGRIAASLDPTFQARALGIATEMVADAALEAAGAQAAGDRRLGESDDEHPRLLWARFASRLSFRSVWFRNAVRGAAGLALAVAVVEVTDVEHGFWVVLGTLSVLRSNALGTGATALRAVAGTTVGFVVGSAIMIGVSGHSVLLWVVLPLAVLVSGVAPSMISFAAGQAGFTLVVIILFNIIAPVGWRVGLTRIEDVAIGCGVSIVVGLLFWPRGATAALGRALSDAFVASSGYLSDAVDRLTSSHRGVDTGPGQLASHRAYLRLDDAFRQFLTEQGAKVVGVETVATLMTGSNRIRLAAYTLASLPTFSVPPGQKELESVSVAGAVLRDSYASSHRWYEEFAELLADRRQALDPPPMHDETLDDVLKTAFADARDGGKGELLRTTMHMLWADELLENQRQVQADLAGSAGRFASRRRAGTLI